MSQGGLEGLDGGLEASLRGGAICNRGQTRSRDGSSTHPVGWACRQRQLHASCAPHGEWEWGVGRQPGLPPSLHKTSSQVHTVGLRVRCTAKLSDNCCAPETDTHSHTHPPTSTPIHSLAQTPMVCDPEHTPSEAHPPPTHTQRITQVLSTDLGIHSFIQQVFIERLLFLRC